MYITIAIFNSPGLCFARPPSTLSLPAAEKGLKNIAANFL